MSQLVKIFLWKNMNMHIGSPLVNLALLEAMKGQRVTDEIDIFIPYLVLAICAIEHESFDIQDVKQQFIREFSITPPEPALQTILTRAKKRGFINLKNQRYFKIPEKLNQVQENSNQKRIKIQRSLNALLVEFKDFSQNKHNITISNEEAESFLYKYISKNISAFIDILSGNGFNVDTKVKNKDYLTASFITYLNKEKLDKLTYLDDVVKGLLLANYITYADKITSKSSFTNITVYLDSPVILGALGYSGNIQKRSLSEFLDLLTSLKINVCVFDITIDEIERLFGAWMDGLEKKEYTKFKPKTLELLMAKGLDSIALETEKALLESKISQLGIQIQRSFSINNKFQCDEQALEEHLRNSGLNIDLRHDVTCISRIHNIRGEQKIKSFDSKFSIFVTLNSTLERLACKYFSTEQDSKSIPLVSSEKWMATVLWLKKPNLFTTLPSNLLLSHAYSTIYSDDKFWSSFITRLTDLKKRGQVSEADFALVRWDKSLIEKVHDTSIETGEDFKNEDIFDVIEDIKKQHSDKVRKELLELDDAKNQELAEETRKRQKAEISNFRLIEKIKTVARVISHVISFLVCLMLFVFIAVGLYISTPNAPLFDKPPINIDTSWANLPVAVLLIFSLAAYLSGTTIKGLYKTSQIKIEKLIIDLFKVE